MRHISLAVTILPAHLFLLHTQIQKNSFHYCCLTKGHIRQRGVVSVSTDAFSGLTHPLAVLCVPLSTCTAPPFFLPLWLCNPWHNRSPSLELTPPTPFPSPPQTQMVSCSTLSLTVYLALAEPPNCSPHPGGS